jgi:uncharacterized protein (DUF1800 family)
MRPRAAALLAVAAAFTLTGPQVVDRWSVDAAAADSDKAILHILNRIGYGPRPGDIEKVREMGLERYIDQQLHPEKLADAGMEARLAGLETVHLSSRQISEQYEQPQIEMRRQRQLQAGNNGNNGQPPDPSTMTPEMRRAMQANQQQAQSVLLELQEQKLLRAVYSDKQLQEVMADFWFNHFNVDARKGRVRFLLTEYERESIRPHVLGKFRDLLEATAKSPAMLFYLDNFQSVSPDAATNQGRRNARPTVARGRIQIPFPQQPPAQARPNAPRGINENYARELMELHTLGVDGGYTQKDVTEVARAFTGWSIDNPRQGGGFVFNARLHDEKDKVVLGHQLKSGGIKDGQDVLDILASQPATARFISTKLARRFVSDTPPKTLVDRLAAKFTSTKGDIREVMRTLLTSPEFQSPDAYRAKVKPPLAFVDSSVRATGADIVSARPLVNAMQQLGMPLYQCQPPTGYKDTAEAWTNTGALVSRMNFATMLSGNRQLGMGPQQMRSLQSRDGLDSLIEDVLGNDIADTTRATIAKATNPPQMLALTLGSPEFQRR